MTEALADFEDFEKNEAASRVIAEESQEFKQDGNLASAEAVTTAPKTLDELLAICQVDLDIWKVDRYTANTWQQGSKIGDAIVVTPLFQIKAYLVRKKLEAVLFPEVQPVHFTLDCRLHTALNPQPANPTVVERAVIIPDIQCGFRRDHRTGAMSSFHDRQAMELAWDICADVQPETIVLLGDNLDLPEFSDKFVKSPEFYWTTQAAVAELAWWLARLRLQNPHARIVYIEGNHDRRFLLSVVNHNIASYDLRPADDLDGPSLMSIERLLGLEKLDIEYHGPYPQGEFWINNNLMAHHGNIARAKSGMSTKVAVEDARHSTIQGHIHRIEMASKTVWARGGAKVYVAFSPGTLAKIDPGAVPAHTFRNNWQQGLAVVEYEKDNGFFNTYPLHIYRGVCVYGGRRWEARTEDAIAAEIQAALGSQVKVI